MCVGENCAPQAVHYMNAQLAALHDNAVACLKDHDPAHKPQDQTRYSHALAEYAYIDPHSKGHHKMFQASFDKPQLEFICNHDAILRLRIKKGYYRLDYTKASSVTYSDKDRLQMFSDAELAYRIPFDQRSIAGKDSKIGNHANLIQLIVLNLTKAQLISAEPAVVIGREALTFYLSQYLSFLQQAGNHVLFSLPDFDDDRYRLTTDYSLMGAHVLAIDEVYGIAVDKINAYLSSVWLKASMLAGGLTGQASDWKTTCIAEFRSTWTLDASAETHFHLKLGAPRIKPICSREAVLYFTVDEVTFYDSADFEAAPSQRYTGWEIALLVDLIHEVEADGQITRCKIDMTTARLYHQFCAFTGLDEHDEIALTFCSRLVEFFSGEYLDILETVDFHVVYFYDTRWPVVTTIGSESEIEIDSVIDVETFDEKESWSLTTPETRSTHIAEWKETITRCDMLGFDQITAVSQSTINVHYKTLRNLALESNGAEYFSALSSWTYDQYFHSTFRSLAVRLLSNGRAIVWVRMKHGWLKTLRNWLPWSESEKYHFEGWHLAFEVEIKKCTHSSLDVSETFLNKYKDSLIWKEHGDRSDRILEHIYLDLRNAEFLHEFSGFDGLFHAHDVRPIDKVQAVVHYLKNHYFPHLASQGVNILHTVPVYKAGLALPSYALTSIAWHVYSKAEITRHTWSQVSAVAEPAIVIVGVTGSRTLPATRLEYSANWVVRVSKTISYGTVSIARSVFMEERLLKLLSRVNSLTTIIPLFSGIDNGVWKLELTTWAEHDWRKGSACNWKPLAEANGVKKYIWQHRDGWSYEHEGTGDVANGTYSVSCLTRNFIELPNASRQRSLDIKIWGEVELEMSFSSGNQRGSAKSTARWNALVSLRSDIGGLKVNVSGSLVPTIDRTAIVGESPAAKFTDPYTHLKAHLPGTVDLEAVVQELRTFEGVWHYGYIGLQAYCLANPVFDLKGDVMFELRPQALQVAQSAAAARRQVSTSSSRVRPARTNISRGSSFFAKAKEIVQTALHSQTESHSVAANGHNGYANGHGNGYTNGHTANGGVYSSTTMTYGAKTEETEIEEEEDQLSFLVPEVTMA
ncbi:hypothetical protein WOLCODRAFT_115316 [Wolfiporia cocos MD-104 SS10]|uniref:Uncharacterized protein n=1 Tax=Wolfiporia cocos (strain MD-104) TaxID=742152 RepID=A0A2H3JEX0_WOLCO|nr:hypothetical protein WOLCODRAFT_115316 [Wolfiporia cocos MD-104 SS10]